MSYKELYEWYEHYSIEPFMVDRIEVQLAIISNLIAGFGGAKTKYTDFMITKKVEVKKTQKEIEDSIKAKFAAFAI